MKRTLFALLLSAVLAGCHNPEPDDRCLALLQGPVREVIPSDEGEMMLFDSLGRITYIADVDRNLNAREYETRFAYVPWDDGRVERIELVSRGSEMINRRRCAVKRSKASVEMQYFKIRMSSGQRVFRGVCRTFQLQDGRLIRKQEPDSSVTEYYYAKGGKLPCKARFTDVRGNESVIEYEYPEIDPMGNWLTRVSNGPNDESVFESRMIRYYE